MASICAGCGNSLPTGDRFCRVCGRDSTLAPAPHAAPAIASPVAPSPVPAPVPTAAASAPPETNGKAIVSLVCGLFLFFPPAWIAAIIFGHLSLSEIKKSGGRLQGQGLALAGLILGYLGVASIPIILIIAAIAIPNLLRARMAANESSAVANVRTINAAEVNYSVNHAAGGFTCSFSDLAGDRLISGELASGQKTGYAFVLENCSPAEAGATNVKYQIVAYPVELNQTGTRAFCSDESGVIKVDANGSAQGCLENGSPLS